VPSQNSNVKARQKLAREAFGRMLRRWRESNGWSQYTGEAWAKAADFSPMSHGGLSPLENGLTKTPQFATFAHFAEINRRLQAQDFTGVKSHELLSKLTEARPMLDDDGTLLEEEQLFGMHSGTRRIPAAYWVPPESNAPELTDADAVQLCKAWRQLVRAEAARRGFGLVRCLGELGDLVPAQHRDQLQDVLAGASNYSTTELLQLWNGKELLPQAWLEIWLAGPKALAPAPAGGGGGLASLTSC
jgi:transcriptional regulator with XRE-family HTH domain